LVIEHTTLVVGTGFVLLPFYGTVTLSRNLQSLRFNK